MDKMWCLFHRALSSVEQVLGKCVYVYVVKFEGWWLVRKTENILESAM